MIPTAVQDLKPGDVVVFETGTVDVVSEVGPDIQGYHLINWTSGERTRLWAPITFQVKTAQDLEMEIVASLTKEYRAAEAVMAAITKRVYDHFMGEVQAHIAKGDLDAACLTLEHCPDHVTKCFALDALRQAGWTKKG